MVTIVAPYVAPVPHTQALCSLSFEKNKLQPTMVDNDAKACLDEVALDLQKQPDARVVVVGQSTAREKTSTTSARHRKIEDLAAERAVNAKHYLVTEKGIDPTRVSVATGPTHSQAAQNYLVPSGADFVTDVTGTTPVDETVVKPPAVRKPMSPKPAHKKTAARAKPDAVASPAPAGGKIHFLRPSDNPGRLDAARRKEYSFIPSKLNSFGAQFMQVLSSCVRRYSGIRVDVSQNRGAKVAATTSIGIPEDRSPSLGCSERRPSIEFNRMQ